MHVSSETLGQPENYYSIVCDILWNVLIQLRDIHLFSHCKKKKLKRFALTDLVNSEKIPTFLQNNEGLTVNTKSFVWNQVAFVTQHIYLFKPIEIKLLHHKNQSEGKRLHSGLHNIATLALRARKSTTL